MRDTLEHVLHDSFKGSSGAYYHMRGAYMKGANPDNSRAGIVFVRVHRGLRSALGGSIFSIVYAFKLASLSRRQRIGFTITHVSVLLTRKNVIPAIAQLFARTVRAPPCDFIICRPRSIQNIVFLRMSVRCSNQRPRRDMRHNKYKIKVRNERQLVSNCRAT